MNTPEPNLATLPLRGLIAATFTPFDASGEFAPSLVGPIVEHLLNQSLSGVFLGGSTGEGPSLTCAERMAMAEAYIEHLDGRLPSIIHVGHNSLRDAAALARNAQELGAFAIAMTPPSYFPIQSVDRVVDCIEEVAEAVPDMPLYYYHIPPLTAVQVDVLELLELASARLPSLIGIKYSEPSLDRLQRCVDEHGDRMNLLFGVDEMLLSGLAAGAHGAVGSTYGFLGSRYAQVISAFERGDIHLARQLQGKITRMVHAMTRHQGLPALKAAMELQGVRCGAPRLPLRPLASESLAIMRRELDSMGFFAAVTNAEEIQ